MTTRELLKRRWMVAGLVYVALIGAILAAERLLPAARKLIHGFGYFFYFAFAGPYLYMYRTRCLSCGSRLGLWAIYSLREIFWRWGPRGQGSTQAHWRNCPRCGVSIDAPAPQPMPRRR